MSKNKQNINLNINKDDSDINDFIYCWSKFEDRPNKITLHSSYNQHLFTDFISKHEVSRNIFTEIIPSPDEDIINDKILIQIEEDIYLSYVVVDRKMESSIVSDLTFFYKSISNLELIESLIDELKKCTIEFYEDESSNLNTLTISSSNSLEIEPIDLDDTNGHFDCYYNEKTFKEVDKLIKKIKKSNKGLSVLWGERGTGKSSIINYIAKKLDRIVIFIPNNLIDHTINNPDFRKFLKKYDKPILVIDDCEMLFNEFFNKSNIITNNLLQLIDGFLSDLINLNVITIFNVEDESEIDHTILDCNNLIDSVYFDYLTSDESKELSSILNYNKKYKSSTKLIDVIKKNNNIGNKKIGF